MRREKREPVHFDNNGFALVTVIVIISFISILATVGLYASGVNFVMKTTDIKNKTSFYDGEQAMEEIRIELTKIAQEALVESYTGTVQDGALTGLGKKSDFATNFSNAYIATWNVNVVLAGDTNSYIMSMLDPRFASKCTITMSDTAPVFNAVENCLELKDVTLTYTDANYFTTKITTDFRIYVPDQKWEVEVSEKTTLPSGYQDLLQEDLDVSECVKYYNWEKK